MCCLALKELNSSLSSWVCTSKYYSKKIILSVLNSLVLISIISNLLIILISLYNITV